MNALALFAVGVLVGASGLWLAAELIESWGRYRARRRRRWMNGRK